jgi:hypothetical protein
MPSFRARLNTAFGNIEIEFDDERELDDRLRQSREFARHISEQAGDFVVLSKQEGDPFGDLRSVSSGGRLQLLKMPENKGDTVRLAVFLASRPPSWAEMIEISGVSNPLAYVKKGELVKDPNDRYTLEAKARQHVVNTLIPALRRTR